MESLRKVYSYKPARIAIKFVICLAGVKIVGDLIYLPYLNIRVTFPRFVIVMRCRVIWKDLYKVL